MASEAGRVKAKATIEPASTAAFGNCKIVEGVQGEAGQIASSGDMAGLVPVKWDWAYRKDDTTGNWIVRTDINCPVPLSAIAAAY